MTNLSFAVRPKVDTKSDELVNGGVRALIHKNGGECGQRQKGEASFEAAVNAGPGEESERPLPCEEDETKQEVDDLQHRYRLDSGIQRLCEKVPEYLGPEEARDSSSNLVYWKVSNKVPSIPSQRFTYTKLPPKR